jgi:prefoldin subunit 5
MTDSQDSDYEFIEVKVSKKIDIHLSLDDLISALQQQADALASSKQQVDRTIADRLNQLNQLAHQIKSELPGGGS